MTCLSAFLFVLGNPRNFSPFWPRYSPKKLWDFIPYRTLWRVGMVQVPSMHWQGCTDFDNASDRGCHGYETKVHVSIDSWVGSYSSARDKFYRQNPRIASVDLGGMGCLAVVSFRCFQCVGVEENFLQLLYSCPSSTLQGPTNHRSIGERKTCLA